MKNRLNDTITFILIFLFFYQNMIWAQGISATFRESLIQKEMLSLFDLSKLDIPTQYGVVKEFWAPQENNSNKRIVLHIQDSHVNLEAQNNIARILESIISKDNKNSLVVVEGAEGEVDCSIISKYPDGKAKRIVSDYLLQEGSINGAEYYTILSKSPLVLYGAEDRAIYNENLLAFKELQKMKPGVKIVLTRLSKRLKVIWQQLTPEQKKYTENTEGYHSNKIDLEDYVEYLMNIYDKKDKNNFINLKYFLHMVFLRDKIDFGEIEKERMDLIKELKAKLVKEEIMDILAKGLDYQVNKLSPLEYFKYLRKYIVLVRARNKELGRRKHYRQSARIKKKMMYENLLLYIPFLKLEEKINRDELFKELNKIECLAGNQLFAAEKEKRLKDMFRTFVILQKFLELHIYREDFYYYKSHRSEFTSVGLDEEERSVIREFLSVFEQFCDLGIRRDSILVNNTLGKMEEMNRGISILITGGFHTEGVAEQFREQGISYAVISPKMTTSNHKLKYISLMCRKNDLWEKILAFSGTRLAKFTEFLNNEMKVSISGEDDRKMMLWDIMLKIVTAGENLNLGYTKDEIEKKLEEIEAGRKGNIGEVYRNIIGKIKTSKAEVVNEEIELKIEIDGLNDIEGFKVRYTKEDYTGGYSIKLANDYRIVFEKIEKTEPHRKKDVSMFPDESAGSKIEFTMTAGAMLAGLLLLINKVVPGGMKRIVEWVSSWTSVLFDASIDKIYTITISVLPVIDSNLELLIAIFSIILLLSFGFMAVLVHKEYIEEKNRKQKIAAKAKTNIEKSSKNWTDENINLLLQNLTKEIEDSLPLWLVVLINSSRLTGKKGKALRVFAGILRSAEKEKLLDKISAGKLEKYTGLTGKALIDKQREIEEAYVSSMILVFSNILHVKNILTIEELQESLYIGRGRRKFFAALSLENLPKDILAETMGYNIVMLNKTSKDGINKINRIFIDEVLHNMYNELSGITAAISKIKHYKNDDIQGIKKYIDGMLGYYEQTGSIKKCIAIMQTGGLIESADYRRWAEYVLKIQLEIEEKIFYPVKNNLSLYKGIMKRYKKIMQNKYKRSHLHNAKMEYFKFGNFMKFVLNYKKTIERAIIVTSDYYEEFDKDSKAVRKLYAEISEIDEFIVRRKYEEKRISGNFGNILKAFSEYLNEGYKKESVLGSFDLLLSIVKNSGKEYLNLPDDIELILNMFISLMNQTGPEEIEKITKIFMNIIKNYYKEDMLFNIGTFAQKVAKERENVLNIEKQIKLEFESMKNSIDYNAARTHWSKLEKKYKDFVIGKPHHCDVSKLIRLYKQAESYFIDFKREKEHEVTVISILKGQAGLGSEFGIAAGVFILLLGWAAYWIDGAGYSAHAIGFLGGLIFALLAKRAAAAEERETPAEEEYIKAGEKADINEEKVIFLQAVSDKVRKDTGIAGALAGVVGAESGARDVDRALTVIENKSFEEIIALLTVSGEFDSSEELINAIGANASSGLPEYIDSLYNAVSLLDVFTVDLDLLEKLSEPTRQKLVNNMQNIMASNKPDIKTAVVSVNEGLNADDVLTKLKKYELNMPPDNIVVKDDITGKGKSSSEMLNEVLSERFKKAVNVTLVTTIENEKMFYTISGKVKVFILDAGKKSISTDIVINKVATEYIATALMLGININEETLRAAGFEDDADISRIISIAKDVVNSDGTINWNKLKLAIGEERISQMKTQETQKESL